MFVPRLTGYPVDRTIVQHRQRELRARKLANRRGSSRASTWLRRS